MFRMFTRRVLMAVVGLLIVSPLGMAPPASAATLSTTLSVPTATDAWKGTGISPSKGVRIRVTATGSGMYCGSDPACAAPNPDGDPDQTCDSGYGDWTDLHSYDGLRGVRCLVLVGRWGSGRAFVIGKRSILRAPGGQELFLGIHDWWWEDNSGRYRVTVAPVVPISSAGGSRRSVTQVICNRDMTVPQGDALLRCDALVADGSAQPGSRTPTGSVSWQADVGQVAPARCDLVAPTLGGTASCRVTLAGTSADIPIGADTPIVASYGGDALYGPSDASPQAFGAARGPGSSAQYGPACSPATTPRPTIGCGDPVNPATGNLSLEVVDLVIEGRGPALEVARTYNTQAAAAGEAGRFGAGWSDAYGARIETGPKRAVTVHLGTGATVPFTARGGRFTAPGWVTASLAPGPGRGHVLTFSDRRTLTFDRTGRLVTLSDRADEPVTLAYADDGTLATATDASGRVLTFTTDAQGHVTAVTDPAGRVVRYAHDAAGDLVSVTDVAGGVTMYAYDGRHRMVSVTDPTGAVTSTTHDDEDRVVGQVDPLGNTLAFAYTGSFPDVVTVVTDGNGHRSAYQYQAGVLTSRTAGLDTDAPSTTSHVHDADLALVATIDANGQPWRTTRDRAGNVLTSTDPLGRTTTVTWDKRNDPTSITTPMGVTTRIGYDDRGLVTSVTAAAGTPVEATVLIRRDDPEHPADITSVTDPMGAVTTFSHDEHGAVTGVVDALGDTSSMTRDILGWVGALTDPLGSVTTVGRDAFGDPVGLTDALGATTLLGRDAARRPVSTTDALGNVTVTEHDAAGRAIGMTLPDGTVLRTGHDAIGDVTSQTDGNGAVSTLAHDPQRRPITWTDPSGGAWRMTWDPAGQLLTSTDPLGRVTTNTWDAAGQLVAIEYSDDTPGVTFTHDADGRRTSMTDGSGTASYTHDPLGRLTSVTDGAGSTVLTTYDAAGRITAITYPDGGVIERDHDALGRPIAIRDWLGHESTFAWDAAGRLTGIRQGDGTVTSRTYDGRGDLLAITVTAADSEEPLLSFVYERDPLGRVSSISGSLDPVTTRVSRDTRGRLTAVGDESFAVDAAGNLVGLRGSTLTYDAAGRLLAAQGPTGSSTFTSDAAGQRTSSTIGTQEPTPHTWDAAGRLVAIGATSHAYDGDGLRMASTLGDGSTSGFTWLRSAGLPLLLGDGSSWFIHGPGGMPLEEIRADGSVRWFHLDQAGSVRALTDETGVVSATFTWDAYGLPVTSTGPASTRLGFQGGHTDPDTGLQYLQARYYDPATGRFLGIDPLVLATREPYAFANGDPLTFADPAGTSPLTGGRVTGDPYATALLDALGFPSSGGAAMCEMVDQAQADLPGTLSSLEATFTGRKQSGIFAAFLREAARQQTPLHRQVTETLRRMDMSDSERAIEAYYTGVQRAIEAGGPMGDETLSLVRQGITDHVDPSRVINWEWVLRQGMH